MMAVYKGCKVKTEINKNIDQQLSHRQKPYKLSHNVDILKGSLAEKIFGTNNINVNSCHNSAIINNHSCDCYASGIAPDGTIEIIEMSHPWSDFVLGVQWHPERTFKINDENSIKLFSSFIKAASDYHLKKYQWVESLVFFYCRYQIKMLDNW